MMIWIWLGVVVVSLIIEFLSVSMTSLWFAFGGLISLILSAIGVDVVWQVCVFSVVSLACLLSLRKVALKFLYKNKELKTNTDAFVGKHYILLSEINENQLGTIKIDGVFWSCKGEDDTKTILAGEKVEIVKISGNKLVVKEIENKNDNLDNNEKDVSDKDENMDDKNEK